MPVDMCISSLTSAASRLGQPSEPRKQVSQFFTVHVLIQAWRQHLRGTIEARAAAAPGLTLK